MKGYHLYWGDTHTQFSNANASEVEQTLDSAEEFLDFLPIIYYPYEVDWSKGFPQESCTASAKALQQWSLLQQTVAQRNSPGKFLTFLGHEWHGRTGDYGDHNIIYLRDHEPFHDAGSLPELFEQLRKTEAIAIPHHTGYPVGERGKNWDYHDDKLTPCAEVFSIHGSSEGSLAPLDLMFNRGMGPRVSGGTIQDGLAKGLRIGLIGSGDHPPKYVASWGQGLVGVYARELTREAIWEAFQQRRVYAVTGDRIELDFAINDHVMGQLFSANGPLVITAAVTGSQAVDRIELIRNNKVIHSYCHLPNWDYPVGQVQIRAKIKIECGWGPLPFEVFNIEDKKWKGSLEIRGGKIVSVEPCFTYRGQELRVVSDTCCQWSFLTKTAAVDPLEKACFQGLIVEIEGPAEAMMSLTVESQAVDFSLEQSLERSFALAMRDELRKYIEEKLRLPCEKITNPDVFWHNAYKVRVHRAVPAEGYRANMSFTDEEPPPGRNFYYLRVSQLNGQMAWSSPIWVDC